MSGRPPIPPTQRRTEALAVYVSPAQMRTLKKRAAAKHMTVSTYLLMAGLGELLPSTEEARADSGEAVS